MDIQQIGELLVEILQRLQVLEAIHTQGHMTMSQLADRRRQRLEDYRRAYYATPYEANMEASNQDGEDEIDHA